MFSVFKFAALHTNSNTNNRTLLLLMITYLVKFGTLIIIYSNKVRLFEQSPQC